MAERQEIERVIYELGFTRTYSVQNRNSIIDLFPKKRSGLYVLHFSNGEYYVGKSVNVVNRFLQHRQNHHDIEKISFRSLANRDLHLFEERHATFHLEKCGFALRNINNVTFSYAAETDFDKVMSKEEQKRWLNDIEFIDTEGKRGKRPRIGDAYQLRYEKLITLPFSSEIISVVRDYIHNSIPAIKHGEATFWNCSCLSNKNKSRYVRINVGGQTTFDAYLVDNEPYFVWYLTRSLAEDVFGIALNDIDDESGETLTFENYPEMEVDISNSGLSKGGVDQVLIGVSGLENAHYWIHDTYMMTAVRMFNLGLVQKGPCLWGKNHCFELADRLVE